MACMRQWSLCYLRPAVHHYCQVLLSLMTAISIQLHLKSVQVAMHHPLERPYCEYVNSVLQNPAAGF